MKACSTCVTVNPKYIPNPIIFYIGLVLFTLLCVRDVENIMRWQREMWIVCVEWKGDEQYGYFTKRFHGILTEYSCISRETRCWPTDYSSLVISLHLDHCTHGQQVMNDRKFNVLLTSVHGDRTLHWCAVRYGTVRYSIYTGFNGL